MSRISYHERAPQRPRLSTGPEIRDRTFRTAGRTFHYESLISAKDDIRLLEVHPYDDRHHIRCTLTSWTRAAASRRGYRALSYCWGSTNIQYTVLVNGWEFKVRKNLHEFLEHAARLKAEQRPGWTEGLYWIDAMCINQQDEDEKAVQLSRMANVYLSAAGTCIWLGPEDNHVSVALGFIEQCYRDQNNKARRRNRGPKEMNMEKVLPSLSLVLSVPYWKRVWILQEIAASDYARMAKRSSRVGHIRVVCGLSEVPWKFLMVLPLTVQIQIHHNQLKERHLESLIRQTHGVWLISWLYAAGSGARLSVSPHGTLHDCLPLDLPLLICLSEYSEASVPQDYIYALVGLLDQDHDPILAPTMKLTGCQVLCYAMRSMIQTSIHEGGRDTKRLEKIAMRSHHGRYPPAKLMRHGERCCGTQHASKRERLLCEAFSSSTSHCDALESCRTMARCLRRFKVLAKLRPRGASCTLRILRDCVEETQRIKLGSALAFLKRSKIEHELDRKNEREDEEKMLRQVAGRRDSYAP